MPYLQTKQGILVVVAAALAFFATSNAQLSDLPNLKTITDVVGATSSASSSASSASSNSQSSTTGATRTSNSDQASTTTKSSFTGGLTNAPTLYGVGVPPLIVPDTSGAPFMQKSKLPEGFVFICVAAALAFLGFSVLLWRGLVAWSLHRSVKRAASDRFMIEKKAYRAAPTKFSDAYHSANVSLEQLAAKGTPDGDAGGQHRLSKPIDARPPKRQSRQATSSQLFFSPTAGQGGPVASNRTSTYLPAGYYASGASALGAGAALASIGGPPAAGYESIVESPPSTPPATRAPQSSHDRSLSREGPLSTRDLPSRDNRRSRNNVHTSTTESASRAPSAVLDELFHHSTGMGRR